MFVRRGLRLQRIENLDRLHDHIRQAHGLVRKAGCWRSKAAATCTRNGWRAAGSRRYDAGAPSSD
jgi:hypothetical protein